MRRRRVMVALVAAGVLATACDGEVRAPADPAAPTSPAVVADPSPHVTSTGPGDVARADALEDAVFLTAVDEVVAGTVYEGLVDVTPGEFLVTADLVCEQLDDGRAPEEVLSAYLVALGAEEEPTAEDARLAGALVGAAVEVYCPRHGP